MIEDRAMLVICIDRYIADIRRACLEDQGDADGLPGTLGHTMQADLAALRARVRGHECCLT